MSESVLLAILGGVLALDATSVGQFMISRPIVGATLAGWLLGDPASGLAVGALLELFHLAGMPAGGTRIPEAGPASVAAVAVAASLGGAPGLALGLAIGLVTSDLGGWTVELHRQVNTLLVARMEDGPANPTRLDATHLAAISVDFVRGAAVTALAVATGEALARWVDSSWPLELGPTVALLLVGASVHLGALLRTFGGWRSRRVVFMAGAAAGLIGVYFS